MKIWSIPNFLIYWQPNKHRFKINKQITLGGEGGGGVWKKIKFNNGPLLVHTGLHSLLGGRHYSGNACLMWGGGDYSLFLTHSNDTLSGGLKSKRLQSSLLGLGFGSSFHFKLNFPSYLLSDLKYLSQWVPFEWVIK